MTAKAVLNGVQGHFPVVLASASPRRAELLSRAGVRHTVFQSGYDEAPAMVTLKGQSPWAYGARLKKVLGDIVRGKAQGAPAAALVLSFDTVVWIPGEVFGKPENLEGARAMLKKLSGRGHRVTTACRAAWPGGEKIYFETSRVWFRHLTDPLIEAAWARDPMLDAAGAYKVQGPGLAFVKNIKGDYHNVVGLPLPFLCWVAGAMP